MKLDKNTRLMLSNWLLYLATGAVLLSAVGWVGPDIWLASTQWLLVALVLVAFGIYLKLG